MTPPPKKDPGSLIKSGMTDWGGCGYISGCFATCVALGEAPYLMPVYRWLVPVVHAVIPLKSGIQGRFLCFEGH